MGLSNSVFRPLAKAILEGCISMSLKSDIIAQAEAVLKRHDPINQGFYTSMPSEDIQMLQQLLAEAKAWKAKAIEERAMERAYYEISEGGWCSWSAFQKHCPEETKQYLEQAARELAEEMRLEGRGDE